MLILEKAEIFRENPLVYKTMAPTLRHRPR